MTGDAVLKAVKIKLVAPTARLLSHLEVKLRINYRVPNKMSAAVCLRGPEGATLSWRISFSFAAHLASESSPAPLAVNTANQPLCSRSDGGLLF